MNYININSYIVIGNNIFTLYYYLLSNILYMYFKKYILIICNIILNY